MPNAVAVSISRIIDSLRRRYPGRGGLEAISPRLLFFGILAVILITEIVVMNLLPMIYPGRTFDWLTNLTDGVLISLIVAPCLWLCILLPLMRFSNQSAKMVANERFLSHVSSELASSINFQVTLKTTAQLPVPQYADWCFVNIEDKDQKLPISAIGHTNQELAKKLLGIHERPSALQNETTAQAITLRSKKTLIWPEIVDSKLITDGLSPGQIEILQNAEFKSCICSPLKARGKIFGTLTLLSVQTNKRYSEADISFVENFANRVALSIDHAVLYSNSIELSKAKDNFLAMLSHELRTPLNVIDGWIHILKTETLNSSEFQQAIDTLERNINLQGRLINDLLDVSRIIAGKVTMESTLVNVNEVLDSSALSATVLVEKKKIRLLTEFEKEPNFVLGDFSFLQRMIVNLLSNSIKFTAEGGSITLASKVVGNEIVISVRDTGMGIEADFIPYVFETFKQEDSSISRSFGGLGLGLSISRYIVERHKGSIQVFSEGKGKGTEFQVRLPLATADQSSTLGQKQSRGSSPLSQKPLDGVRVLLVDDAPDMLLIFTKFLTSSGAEVIAVTSAAEAYDKLKVELPDIMLSDIGMPEEDGYSLIRRIRNLSALEGGQTLAIALTAYAHADEKQQALKAGFQSHLSKPIKRDALINKILQTLENSRREEPPKFLSLEV